MTQHRIDILPRISKSKKEKYVVPCGMSTIFYLSHKRPSHHDLTLLHNKLSAMKDHIAIQSYYDLASRSYLIEEHHEHN